MPWEAFKEEMQNMFELDAFAQRYNWSFEEINKLREEQNRIYMALLSIMNGEGDAQAELRKKEGS